MATAAQILANQTNAQRSTGPVTAEGKSRSSQNAAEAHRQPLRLPLCAAPKTLGLFSAAGFVRSEEREIFNEFESACMAELSPASPLEDTLAREIVHAAWRLRRCADLESWPPENATPDDLGRLQASIDRARAAASRSFHRALAELRRLQAATRKQFDPLALLMNQTVASQPPAARAKQSQSPPATPAPLARNSPCPCGSRQKYKRCCGPNAPAVLGAQPEPARKVDAVRPIAAR